jgi:hypothetical protein
MTASNQAQNLQTMQLPVLPLNLQTRQLCQRLVWFEPPEQAIADTYRLLAYFFAIGRARDFAVICRYLDRSSFAFALQHAQPGIIDPRSFAYWRLVLDLPELRQAERGI